MYSVTSWHLEWKATSLSLCFVFMPCSLSTGLVWPWGHAQLCPCPPSPCRDNQQPPATPVTVSENNKRQQKDNPSCLWRCSALVSFDNLDENKTIWCNTFIGHPLTYSVVYFVESLLCLVCKPLMNNTKSPVMWSSLVCHRLWILARAHAIRRLRHSAWNQEATKCLSENVWKSKLQKWTCSKAYEHYFQANWIDSEASRHGTYIILLVWEMWACTLARQPWYWSTFVNHGSSLFPAGATGKAEKGKRTALFWLREEILPVWITGVFPSSLHFLSKQGPSLMLFVQTRSPKKNATSSNFVYNKVCTTTKLEVRAVMSHLAGKEKAAESLRHIICCCPVLGVSPAKCDLQGLKVIGFLG